ncbi:Hypothetical protein NATL1_18241 [Prochlorococcus marinus str. NATL1A]|uniref:Phytanoyl-CoA dioxygenase n=1 Tax=Prochlorococcus marinus (strain NATL1A) TaxID=167555 RepID=A2C4H0_PROM1|nr:putative 2OG-Fe(II) oxygenase [Prochlorococcus marinus]ABM76380.1 Hypothetical protein NATL1_18241 [Prochlorococcus marinus str. NATL1A]
METESDKISSRIISVNPEPLGVFTLPIEKHLIYKKCIKTIAKNAPHDLRQKYNNEKYTEHVCNQSNQNIFSSYPELADLKSDINTIILNYIDQIGFISKEIIINDAWVNISKENAILNWHYHANSFISGNYFVNFNSQVDSMLGFKNDRITGLRLSPSMRIPDNRNKQTLYNTPMWKVNLKEGQIVLWRSHLSHGYDEPNKGKNRITLSFNSMPKICTDNDNRYSFQLQD